MRRSWITLALGALVLLPSAGIAQDGEVAVFTVTDRPRIGVMVNTSAGDANDKIGATIGAVTPDGPAAKAGLEAGDIITKFNGTALGGANPGQKLVELAQALSPGDTVKVEYRRGTANRSATIVAADLGGAAYAWTPRPDAGQMIHLRRGMADRERAFVELDRGMAGMGEGFQFRFDIGGLGLDLAEMNAGLGEYFGTSKGVLVLENPSDSTVPLKAGDVILAIDGRAPATVGQARRILGSYDSGDVAKFEIMRMKKKTTVSWTVPAQTHMKMPGGMRWRSAAPPAAPGSMPRMKVKVAPTAPAAPMPRVAAPAQPPVPT
jgi:membrane-associated protease RseP (regulator of RpoE activity)